MSVIRERAQPSSIGLYEAPGLIRLSSFPLLRRARVRCDIYIYTGFNVFLNVKRGRWKRVSRLPKSWKWCKVRLFTGRFE